MAERITDSAGLHPIASPNPLHGTAPSGAPARCERPVTVRWWIELVLVVALYAVYDAVRGLIRGDNAAAVHHGRQLLRIEQLLAIDIEHPVNNWLQHITPLAVPACFFYASAHFLVTPAVLVWTYLRRPADYARARTVLAIVTVSALLGFWLFPTAPPRLLPASGFHDTLAAYSNWGWWSASDSAPRALASVANQFAAFPSLHLSWALWCGVTIWRHARRVSVRVLGALCPLATALVVLATANHYLLDVVSAALIWVATDVTVRSVGNRCRPHPGQSHKRLDERQPDVLISG